MCVSSCVQCLLVLCCFCLFSVFVLLFMSADDRQSEIGNRKLESGTLGNVEDCRFVFNMLYDVDDPFVFLQQCYVLSTVLHAFDKIVLFSFLGRFYYQ